MDGTSVWKLRANDLNGDLTKMRAFCEEVRDSNDATGEQQSKARNVLRARVFTHKTFTQDHLNDVLRRFAHLKATL